MLEAADVHIVVPLEPPTVNHYKKNIGRNRWILTPEAGAFLDAVVIFSRGQRIDGNPKTLQYEVAFRVHQGRGSKGDVDNYSKCILDGLVRAGVIHSDAAIIDLHQSKRRDRENPRTEIWVRQAQEN